MSAATTTTRPPDPAAQALGWTTPRTVSIPILPPTKAQGHQSLGSCAPPPQAPPPAPPVPQPQPPPPPSPPRYRKVSEIILHAPGYPGIPSLSPLVAPE